MPKKHGAFKDWFIEQHGPRELLSGKDSVLNAKVIEGRRAEDELRRRAEWDACLRSACYAWKCSDFGRV